MIHMLNIGGLIPAGGMTFNILYCVLCQKEKSETGKTLNRKTRNESGRVREWEEEQVGVMTGKN